MTDLISIAEKTTQKRVLLILVFVAAFAGYIWRNHFPYFYHSDEESKALQILYGYRNFWHPMLMLQGTDLTSRLFGIERNSQSLTLIGRYLAALFASVGVTALVSFAIARKGFQAGVLLGLFLLCFPLLFEVSHYCKEDPALLMGFALSLCAWNKFRSAPYWRKTIWLGLAVGTAISAKYAGAILLPFILIGVIYHGREWKFAATFLLSTLVCVLIINWEWLLYFSNFLQGIDKESRMLVHGHDGVAVDLPHPTYWRMLLNQHGWLLLFVAILGFASSFGRKMKLSLEGVLGIGLLAGLIALSFSPKISERYLLPFMVVVLYLAAIGIGHITKRITPKYRAISCLFLITICLRHQGSLMVQTVLSFSRDSRAELASWITEHLPAEAKVGYSLWTRIPGIYPGSYLSGIQPLDYAADYGTIQSLREMGYNWVVVADVESSRFANLEQRGSKQQHTTFLRRRLFYEALEKEAKVVWQSPPRAVYILHPGLKLYELGTSPN